MTEQAILTDYRERAEHAQQEAAKNKKLSERFSLLRLVVFASFILAVGLAIKVDEIMIIVIALALLILVFGWLVRKQAGFDEQVRYWQDLKKVIDNEIGSISDGVNIYYDGSSAINDKHYYTSDLDIFGPNSLFQLLNRASTGPGMTKLAGWLAKPADKDIILSRQEAVNEIAAKNDWRLQYQAYLVFCLKQSREQIRNLLNYLKLPVDLNLNPLFRVYISLAPWLLIGLIIAAIFYAPARYLAPLVALMNYRLVSSRSEAIKKTDLIAGKINETLVHFSSAFEMIENAQWTSSLLIALSSKIKADEPESISFKIRQLSRLIEKLNYRLNQFVSFLLNAFLLWDLRQIMAIESWKTGNQQNFELAFDVLAGFEALVSLSSLAINYPTWCFPDIIDQNNFTLKAKNLAHPLINEAKRVSNDFATGQARQISIITGSNMAGKSTFLRTIGINTVLALSGAPVCASEMQVSVMTILSYMRIKDSLNESTSTFKAEIDRLQMLLKAVEGDKKIFFLIDEMLRGTNSVDKYLGSKAVIERLIAKKAVGMVATHDLQIAELEKGHPDYIRNYYFDIQVKNGEMLFDYKIKPGECKTFNASLLLEQIGIRVES